MQQSGGIVLGAFLPDTTLVGFVFGFLGQRNGQLRLCSHQLAVRPDWRGGGIGIRLKLAQRDEALRRGLELITWTFDPLEARNAYINLHRLGAVARTYDRDHYGTMNDDLNRGLPTDRFEAEWWIRKALVREGGEQRAWPSVPGAIVLLREGPQGEPVRGELSLEGANAALIGIPSEFQELKRWNLELAKRWRLESRAAFETALGASLAASDFRRDGWYLMARVARR